MTKTYYLNYKIFPFCNIEEAQKHKKILERYNENRDYKILKLKKEFYDVGYETTEEQFVIGYVEGKKSRSHNYIVDLDSHVLISDFNDNSFEVII